MWAALSYNILKVLPIVFRTYLQTAVRDFQPTVKAKRYTNHSIVIDCFSKLIIFILSSFSLSLLHVTPVDGALHNYKNGKRTRGEKTSE